jgi:hypothetical protein
MSRLLQGLQIRATDERAHPWGPLARPSNLDIDGSTADGDRIRAFSSGAVHRHVGAAVSGLADDGHRDVRPYRPA